MGYCLAAKFSDQREVAIVIFYWGIVMRLVLKKVNDNFLPLTTRKHLAE